MPPGNPNLFEKVAHPEISTEDAAASELDIHKPEPVRI
eukprot:IDg20034t1